MGYPRVSDNSGRCDTAALETTMEDTYTAFYGPEGTFEIRDEDNPEAWVTTDEPVEVKC